jgi:phosphopentomutase
MALRESDDALPAFTAALHEDDLFFTAADHSNGPTAPSDDRRAGSCRRGRSLLPLIVTRGPLADLLSRPSTLRLLRQT